MLANIVRLEKSPQGLLGVFLLDEAIFCFTIEPPDTFVKTGGYHCRRFHGEKWPNTFEIVVPGHTAVLFHAGNTIADTRGCVVLGSTVGKLKGNRAVLNSGDTFRRFLEYTEKESWFKLFITSNIY